MTTTQLALFPYDASRTATGLIYWATDGVNLKHGYTTSTHRRGGQLKVTMLWTGPGNLAEERANHHRWLRHRIPGTAEWYYPAPPLLEYLDDLVLPGTVARMALRMLIFRRSNVAA